MSGSSDRPDVDHVGDLQNETLSPGEGSIRTVQYAEIQQRVQELRESEERTRAVFNAPNEAIFIHDAETGAIIDANTAAEKMFAIPRERFPKLAVADLSAGPPFTQVEAMQRMARALSGGQQVFEWKARHSSGKTFWMEIGITPARIGEEDCLIVVGRNIDERKRTERALQQSEEKYRSVVETSPESIAIVDVDGNLTYTNREFARLHELTSPEEWVGRQAMDLIVPEDRNRAGEILQHLIREGLVADVELQLLKEDGTTFPAELSGNAIRDANGQPTSLLFVARDISYRIKAEEALRESEERLRTVLQTMPVMVDAFDENNTIIVWNRECERVTGYSADETVGNPDAMRLLYPGAGELKHVMSTIERLGGDFRDLEVDLTTKSGEKRTVVWSNLSDSHPVMGWSMWAVGVDITDRKRAQEERDRLEEQIRQSRKMEAIGKLTGGVAHDFNNLLQVINGSTEIALLDLEEDHPARQSLANVAKAGERASRLVLQLLAFSRRQVMRPTNLDLNETVGEMLKMLRRVIGEHVRVRWAPCDGAVTVRADRGMIEQALVNLCLNARDAMPNGGALTIQTQMAVIDDAFCLSRPWARPGRFVMLSVGDTGPGMDKATLDRVFEPFFTTKDAGLGTGLGLATVYGIVKQHRGLICVESTPGRGSSFELYWTLTSSEPDRTASGDAPGVTGGRETILVAEDDEFVLELSRMVLLRAGYTVLTASDGAEAVALFRKSRDRIGLVILDVVMPEMGGREAYDIMRAEHPTLKVLFASGYSEDVIQPGFVLDEGLRLIQKPFARNALLEEVRSILDAPE